MKLWNSFLLFRWILLATYWSRSRSHWVVRPKLFLMRLKNTSIF